MNDQIAQIHKQKGLIPDRESKTVAITLLPQQQPPMQQQQPPMQQQQPPNQNQVFYEIQNTHFKNSTTYIFNADWFQVRSVLQMGSLPHFGIFLI